MLVCCISIPCYKIPKKLYLGVLWLEAEILMEIPSRAIVSFGHFIMSKDVNDWRLAVTVKKCLLQPTGRCNTKTIKFSGSGGFFCSCSYLNISR